MWIKFYQKERDLFRDTFDKKISGKEVEIVFDKIKKHFKIYGYLNFNNRVGGKAHSGGVIEFPYNTSFGVVCHEIAHLIYRKKYGTFKHNKKLMKIIGRVVNYCKRKNYWQDELQRRLEVKPDPLPTRDEVREKKLEKKRMDLIRYEKRLKRYIKFYTNKIRKAKKSIRMLERSQFVSVDKFENKEIFTGSVGKIE